MSGQSQWKQYQRDAERLRELHKEYLALGSEIQGILSRLGDRERRGEMLSSEIGTTTKMYAELLPFVDDMIALSGHTREGVARYTRARYTGPVLKR